MERAIQKFEEETRIKVRRKADSYKQEELLLTRTFQYFDPTSSGKVDLPTLLRVLNRLNIAPPLQPDLQPIFDFYSRLSSSHRPPQANGLIDYYIFVNRVLGRSARGGRSSSPISSRYGNVSQRGDDRVGLVGGMSVRETATSNGLVSHQDFERAAERMVRAARRIDRGLLLKRVNSVVHNGVPANQEIGIRDLVDVVLSVGFSKDHLVKILI